MICAHSRRLFGAFWDDEITQAERESLEAHFASCAACREEYDLYSRAVDLAATLPRVEPAPDLLERTLARTRRVSPAPDRVGAPGFPWVPVTATAALVAVAFTLVSPWLGSGSGPVIALRPATTQAPVGEPELRSPARLTQAASKTAVPGARGASLDRPGVESDPIAAVPDSLFDHGEDVEFILDPMTLRRGRPATLRAGGNVQGQQATITF